MRRLPPILLLVLVPLIAGCAEEPPPPGVVRLPEKDFSLGPPQRFRQPGVYEGLRQSHGVWIASDGAYLIVLNAGCPHDGAGTYFDDLSVQFRCPRCSARFSDMGLPLAGRPGNLALQRLRLELRGGERGDPAAEVWVNPRVRYTFEKQEWSSRFSVWTFEPVD